MAVCKTVRARGAKTSVHLGRNQEPSAAVGSLLTQGRKSHRWGAARQQYGALVPLVPLVQEADGGPGIVRESVSSAIKPQRQNRECKTSLIGNAAPFPACFLYISRRARIADEAKLNSTR